MQVCVSIAGGYDCDWTLELTDYETMYDYCWRPYRSENVGGCTHYHDRRIVIYAPIVDAVGIDGMNVLDHELKHARLYSDCMAKHFHITIQKCYNQADWHG